MNACWTRWLVALACLFALPAVHAAITCTTISSPGVSINYTSNTTASVQTFFTVSCTRTSTNDPTSVTYDVTADNGGNNQRQTNQAQLGTSLLKYDFYEDAACSTAWTGKGKITDTITWTGSATGTITKQTSYWGCVVTKQTPTSSGDYTDSVKLTLKYGNQTVIGYASVDIYAPANCTLTTPAGNINLTYTAFGAQKTGSTTFRVTCTNSMPYTVATDVTEAVLVGLRYTLSLSASSANGIGVPQTFTVTATVPAGQAGTCPSGTCNASNTHTITISY
jgi:spore coat protein U-like protein